MRGQAATQTAARFGRRWAVCSVPLNGWPPRYLQPGGSPPLTRWVAAPLLVRQQHQEAQTVSHSRPRRPHLVHWRAPLSAGGLTGNKHATQTRRHHADVQTSIQDPSFVLFVLLPYNHRAPCTVTSPLSSWGLLLQPGGHLWLHTAHDAWSTPHLAARHSCRAAIHISNPPIPSYCTPQQRSPPNHPLLSLSLSSRQRRLTDCDPRL